MAPWVVVFRCGLTLFWLLWLLYFAMLVVTAQVSFSYVTLLLLGLVIYKIHNPPP